MLPVADIAKILTQLFKKEVSADNISVDLPPAGFDADYTINCFPLAGVIGQAPHEIAAGLSEALGGEEWVGESGSVKGFVNVTLSDTLYIDSLMKFSIPSYESRDETVIVDYNQPNIGKPLHIAHVCTPAFGQATINLLRYKGYTVHGDMHQGDWGGIFGKLIAGWNKWGDEEKFLADPVNHLFDLYIRITALAEEDPEVDQECRDTFRRLSDGDSLYVELWKKFTKESLRGVQEIMDRFLVHPDLQIGESFYEGLPLPKLGDWPDLQVPGETMSHIVEELIEKWVATRNDDGSAGVEFPKETKIPSCVLQKRDGTHGYLASDLACIKYRASNWSPDKILYFVDNRQSLHFRQVFHTAQAGWGLEGVELSHEPNGFVSLEEGAMSSRKGIIIRLQDLLDEAFSRVGAVLEEKGRTLSQGNIEAIAIGAIKYSFLMQDRERDWTFVWDKVLAFDGDSGPYVQYSIVRARKLLADFQIDTESHDKTPPLTSYDRDLIRDLYEFEKRLDKCTRTYKFHTLVGYCYELATRLNTFYANTPKLATEQDEWLRSLRLQLIDDVVSVLQKSFDILGIPVPDEM